MAHINIRSLPKNFLEMKTVMKMINHDFKIIGITETWLNHSTKDTYQLDGYKHVSQVRSTKKVGGVYHYL